jgi:hypothetical protein
MYRQAEVKSTTSEKFTVPFEEKLATDNRWVIMSKLIPWEEFEEEYAKNFSAEGMGAISQQVRKFKLREDRRQGMKAKPHCSVCGSSEHWGIGDIEPFLNLVG